MDCFSHQPAKNAVEALRHNFEDAGFRLGPYVGISSSISGQASLFERYFGTRFEELKSYELPLSQLSADVAGLIEAVTLTARPTFGASESGP